jgi:hypothetical protein
MENATKRIRKARRQGLAGRGLARSPRIRLGGPTRNADLLATPRPNRQRKTRTTHRKAKRMARSRA